MRRRTGRAAHLAPQLAAATGDGVGCNGRQNSLRAPDCAVFRPTHEAAEAAACCAGWQALPQALPTPLLATRVVYGQCTSRIRDVFASGRIQRRMQGAEEEKTTTMVSSREQNAVVTIAVFLAIATSGKQALTNGLSAKSTRELEALWSCGQRAAGLDRYGPILGTLTVRGSADASAVGGAHETLEADKRVTGR
ncbi:hypothetical protein TRVL_06303 [Trypanosoma vivax]|nr:hypothetical protein TRVL_06303 [Trypanosoma vivax]